MNHQWVEKWLIVTTICLSIVAAIWVSSVNGTTLYGDAIAHLMISRRILEGVTTGFAHLGSTWLPLPHLLSALLAWVDPLYYSGIAGSWVSMASYIVATLYIYKIAAKLTETQWGGVVAAGVFGLNLNILYMQATTMTELLMLSLVVAATYHFLVWCHNNSIWQLSLCSLALLFASLTRFEVWFLTAVFGLMLCYVMYSKGFGYDEFVAHAFCWGALAGLGPILWFAWCWVIFGDPLEFQRGEYSNPEYLLPLTNADLYVGSWKYSILTYFYSARHIMGLPLIVLGIAGLAAYLWRERLSYKNIIVTATLSQVVFFILILYAGQRTIMVPELSETGVMINIRFGLIVLVPVALFVGYLTTFNNSVRLLVPLVLAFIVFHSVEGVITLKEAIRMDAETPQSEVEWFRDNYDSKLILAEGVYNERLLYYARVPLSQNIYEGNGHIWESALSDPIQYDIQWIVARKNDYYTDKVWRRFIDGEGEDTYGPGILSHHYELAFTNGIVNIYKRKGLSPDARTVHVR